MDPAIRIVALGGLGEVGMNCMALELDGRLLLVDCGLTFPDREPGVDVIHPDFSYALERADQIEAVVLTHGHEDHVGALPYLLASLNVPVHGPPYALEVAKLRLAEHDLPVAPELRPTRPGERFDVGPFQIEPFRVPHSIPDCTGLILRSAAGTVVHTGDFLLDPDPPDGQHFDEARLQAAAAEGVDLLLSDSTNIDVARTAFHEKAVARALRDRIEQAPARAVVTLFASNVHRLAALLEAAGELGRKVLLLGRSVQTHHQIGQALGLLKTQPVLVAPDEAQRVPRHELLVLATGSQGEHRAAMFRLARGTHHLLRLEAGDQVIFSSRVIPGNELTVHAMVDDLERQGVEVLNRKQHPDLHASGHAPRSDQQRMIELVRPKAFVPVHGTYYHLHRHQQLAQELGVERTLLAQNGDLIELTADGPQIRSHVGAGRVLRQAGQPIARSALSERYRMADAGVVVLGLQLDTEGALLAPVQVEQRGLPGDEACIEDLLEQVAREVEAVLDDLALPSEASRVAQLAERSARRIIRDQLAIRPLVHAMGIESER